MRQPQAVPCTGQLFYVADAFINGAHYRCRLEK